MPSLYIDKCIMEKKSGISIHSGNGAIAFTGTSAKKILR